MNKAINQNQLNLFVLWQHDKKFMLIIFLLSHIFLLGVSLKEYLTNIPERYYPISSSVGVFVYHSDFYLHWIIILFLAIFFLFCPTRIFNRIYFYFYGFVLIYFMVFFLFFIGSFSGTGLFYIYALLSHPLKKETV
ncbi:MAG: hypothetical protein RSA22_01725 [Acinetobacter sp.]|jgi:hypothetical protein